MNPLVAQLSHRSFPELADALRSCSKAITREWEAAVRQAIPRMDRFTYAELKDSTPQILSAIADAVGSCDPEVIKRVVDEAPMQGLNRFHQKYEVYEIMQED